MKCFTQYHRPETPLYYASLQIQTDKEQINRTKVVIRKWWQFPLSVALTWDPKLTSVPLGSWSFENLRLNSDQQENTTGNLNPKKFQILLYNSRVECHRSCQHFLVLPLWICKENCDWLGQTDIMEIASPARFRRRYFWWRQATTGNTSAHAGYYSARTVQGRN